MFPSAEMGNKTPTMTAEYLFGEEHCLYHQLVSKAPLFEPAQRVMGEQNYNIIPIRLKFIDFSARMVIDRGKLVRHDLVSGLTDRSPDAWLSGRGNRLRL